MKSFFKYVFATVVGLILFCLLFFLLTLVSLSAMMMTDSSVRVEDNSVMTIRLSGILADRSQDNGIMGLLAGEKTAGLSVEQLLASIDRAKENEKVKGIYIEGGMLVGAQPAALEEVRNKLLDFKKSGKFILAYADSYTQGSYYLCSVADSVVVNPQGVIDWEGLSTTVAYYKNLLDKIGVKAQVYKVGAYKSAVEPFITQEMSVENKEQLEVFQQEVWKKMREDVGASRKIAANQLDTLANMGLMLADPSLYLKTRLVDKLAYTDEVPKMICYMMKDVDNPKDYHTISSADMAKTARLTPKDPSGNVIAVYFAEGEIGQISGAALSSEGIMANKVCEDLRKLTDDEQVKAIVLRVNSPGGSAYDSEQIWHQVMETKKKKPVIVSMGALAASGGYYISCAADWVVAQPTTITGSIGIFGVIPEAQELLNEKLGVSLQTVKTNEFAGMGIDMMPFTEAEGALLQGCVNRGYELFTKRVADGRHMKQDNVKKIGEGRIWTGIHAKQLGLVDQLGGLDDAIAVAKKRSNTTECSVVSYPEQKTMMERLLAEVNNKDTYADAKLREYFGDYALMFQSLRSLASRDRLQASLPFWMKFNL